MAPSGEAHNNVSLPVALPAKLYMTSRASWKRIYRDASRSLVAALRELAGIGRWERKIEPPVQYKCPTVISRFCFFLYYRLASERNRATLPPTAIPPHNRKEKNILFADLQLCVAATKPMVSSRWEYAEVNKNAPPPRLAIIFCYDR